MQSWFSRLPLTVRLPLAVAVMIVLGVVVATQIVSYSLSMRFETQMEKVSQVYLEGLSRVLLPYIKSDDHEGLQRVLEQTLLLPAGFPERRLLFFDANGVIIAEADNEGIPRLDKLPEKVGDGPFGVYFDHIDSSMWAWRQVATPEDLRNNVVPGKAVANLDLSQFSQARSELQWTLTVMGVLLSGVCGLAGVALVWQVQRSLMLLAEHLENVIEKGPHPVPPGRIPTNDRETGKLIHAFNRMAKDAHEREAMLSRMAEQEREAVLGRMAATLAHEVRNPLGGVLTGIDTLKKFGDDPSVRNEAIEFMERGLLVIQEVANAALTTHRGLVSARHLTPQDLADVRRLAEGEARRLGVIIEDDLQIPESVPVSATEVRQVLLNLLLNAIQATRPGGTVKIRGQSAEHELRLEVIDEGPGMAPELVHGLNDGDLPATHTGLGVDVVVRLLEELQGRISVEAHAGKGTHIIVYLPIGDEPEQR